MHPSIPHLLELQRIDNVIAGLRSELDTYPKLVQQADAKLTGARAAVAAAREEHANGLKERKKVELDATQWKDRARKYRDQSGAVKTNEAYKALLHEIANAEAEVAKAEDRQLEMMMGGEDIERRLKSAEARLTTAEQEIATERNQIKAKQIAKTKEMEAATVLRQRALVPIAEDLRELYSRIAKRHNGMAMAEVRNEQCCGCGMRILPHIFQELRRDSNHEIHRCETCGQILYLIDAPAPPDPVGGAETASSAAAAPHSS